MDVSTLTKLHPTQQNYRISAIKRQRREPGRRRQLIRVERFVHRVEANSVGVLLHYAPHTTGFGRVALLFGFRLLLL